MNGWMDAQSAQTAQNVETLNVEDGLHNFI